MKLLALLLLLLGRRVEWRHDPAQWRGAFDRALRAPMPLVRLVARSASGRVLALVLLWAAAGFLLRFGLADALFGWPLLVIYLAVMWALVGHDRLGPDLNEYLRLWYLQDQDALRGFARERFGSAVAGEGGVAALHRGVLRALFVRAYRETFAWIIVFAVTGLPGLLAFAAIDSLLREAGGSREAWLADAAREMRTRLDSVAVRLLGLTLLLTGNSTRAWPILDSRLLDDEDEPAELAADLGIAAAGLSPVPGEDVDAGLEVGDARGLVLRTQVVWIMLMAVSVIVGF